MPIRIYQSGAIMKYQVRDRLLAIQDVSLTFGTKQVLKNVNGEIYDIVGHGQIVGLLGPSGIGKTQLFRILAGLLKPTTGKVLLNSSNTPVIPGSVGVVAQHYPLFLHHTVETNLDLATARSPLPAKEAKDKKELLLDRFHLKEYLHNYPVQLSGGTRQRVSIVQQMLCSEHFLLMDEPFSGLDPLMNDEVCALMAEVTDMDELNTIIVITHDLRSAIKVADTLWLLGRDRDAQGNIIPGAYIKQTYDLVERNLAWNKNISKTPEFLNFSIEVKEQFRTL
jgi:ABC-type nitrate/sulfonate/bicarbonate transport system ATPase subunit